MKTIIAAAIAMPAQAGTSYVYQCHGGGIVGIAKVDEDRGTLTWRGTVYRDVKQVESGCKAEFQATSNGVTAKLCAATKGVTDLKIGKAQFDCQMRR